ncbi:MAG TPA: ABC transporter permease [Vicinamibacterales bacterium]
MALTVIVAVALLALRRNLLRTSLTALGMLIGVAAVIIIVALGRGAHQAIEGQIMAAGTNMVTVNAGNWTSGGVRMGMGSSSRLTEDDALASRREVPGVAYVSPGVRTRAQIIVGGRNWNTSIEGTGPDFPLIRSWPLALGSFFGSRDVTEAEKVCVLGAVVRDQIFGAGVNPVGQTLRIGAQPFTVVGVLTTKGEGSGGRDQDDLVFIPYTTAQKKLMGVTYLNSISISAASADGVARVADEVRALLRIRHNIAPGDTDDFRVRTLDEVVAMRTQTTATMRTLLVAIAAVALLVGGIGVMNIMLVSVTERTREIGLRVALGARTRDVLLQFLAEAILISTLGGVAGIVAGLLGAKGVSVWFEWPTDVAASAVFVSFGVATAVGVFFGWYPARKAAQINPIDALRFE